ncbi:MAG TPA: hypothetical protein VFW87_00730, partial [Pirellulales bacterium]|nr:hypothetical protein [Pirellulales bacterium]
LIFGIVGSVLMIYAGLISARKKAPTWRIGSAQTWLRGHLWLGSLSIPLILFHAGFRWGGPVEQALLAVLAAIVASGVFGLLLQQFLPRQMTSRVPLETFYAQVPHVCRVLEVEADVAVARLCGPLPLAVSQDDPVATVERLNQLGVSGRNPLTSVYAAPGEAFPPVAPAATPKPAAQEVREVGEPPKPKPAANAASAADKIAMMRAAKAVKRPEDGAAKVAAEAPAPAIAEPPVKPKAALSAADKIAMMRAAKATKKSEDGTAAAADASASAVAEPPVKPKAALSAADKIAMMRAAKAAKKPEDGPVEVAADAPASAVAEAPVKPKAALSAADKIAMMRAAKAAKKPEDGPVEVAADAPAPAVAEAPVKPKAALSAADKIAMMRAAKNSAASAAPIAAATPAAKPTSAAEKIALMRAGKAALAGAAAPMSPAPSPAAKPPSPAKPAPAAKATPAAKPTPAAPRKKPADDDWKQACPEFVRFYLEQVRPFLGVRYMRQSLLADGVQAEGQFAAIGAVLPEPLQPVIARLASLCEERRQLATQVRVHHWLHGWLLLHVPLSVALLVLGVVHVVASLYY